MIKTECPKCKQTASVVVKAYPRGRRWNRCTVVAFPVYAEGCGFAWSSEVDRKN